jgi:serine/threonine protein kinase
MDRSWFIESKEGNIKDEYFFEKKLGSGGYGAVYQAINKKSGQKVAVKAMQKTKISDYESFRNEINILI